MQPPPSHDPDAFLAGGEMGERIRRFDWAATPLGPIEAWPPCLRLSAGILLRAAIPMALLWGEAGVLLYNDAYAAFAAGRHPQLLGLPVREAWPEAAAFNDTVLRTGLAGRTTSFKDQAFTLHLHGPPREVWLNLDYSPVPDEGGRPVGVLAILVDTTARVLAERQQADAVERQRRLFQQAPGFICTMRGPEHVYDFVNDAHIRLFGRADIIGRTVREAFPDLVEQGFYELLDQVYATGQRHVARATPMRLRATPDRPEQDLLLDFIYEPVTDGAGRVIGIFCEGFDVTEAQRGQQVLRESEARFREIADAAPVLIWISDTSKACTWFNRPWLSFTGRSMEQELGYGWAEGVHPEDMARCVATYDAAFDRREAFRMDYRLRREDGTWRVVDDTGVPRFAADGSFLGFIGSCIDVTDQRAAEAALRHSEELLRLATEAAEIGLWDVDMATETMFWPPLVKAMFGISPDRPVTLADFYGGLHPEDAPETIAAFAAACDPARRTVYDVEYRTIGREDGVQRWVAAKGRAIFDEDGRCLRVLGTAIDITARKATEARLRELNETLERRFAEVLAERKLLADIVEGTDAFVQVADLDFRWLAINRAAANEFERSFGIRPRVGLSMLDLLAHLPEEQVGVQRIWTRALSGEAFTEIAEFGAPGRGRRHYEMKFNPLRGADGRLLGAYQFVYDVTERLAEQARLAEAEERLRQSQKMEAVGQLTGGIAHDFNNLLQGVSGSFDLIRRRAEDATRVRRWAEAGLAAAERGAKLTGQLLAFSRAQRLEAKPLFLGRLVEGMREMLARSLGPLIEIRLVLEEGEAPVLSDPTQLEMAVLNLAINARDAMPEGGRLTIATRLRPIRHDPELAPGDYVELAIADTGTGMPSEVVARAFDPFFTTKEFGKGTGLGLSQVYGIARQAGGLARIESRPGAGTTVRLLLRRTDLRVAPEPAVGEGTGPASRPGATILVVEDDAEVLRFLLESLRDLGYRAIPAQDGEAGLVALEGEQPDLAIVDFAMPGMNGAEFAQTARRLRPGLPILFASGYSDTAAIEAAAGPEAALLRKPFRIAELQAALRRALPPAP
ncbi:PAS domain-containing protein [Belnapia sp. T6]|uniref:histidine kinase n=1 Tax=Belnapia mucosa TaxID=2804532 RepID=A0ABS1V9U8_9PROT|nr:PAS domain-containing protein [Belnapia mucosa]MBL6458455.1 PAS domain-containing protein [Belnapia mucosa]